MVAFYKELEDVKAPDWTGASQKPSPKPVDDSLGDLLKNIGNTLDGAVSMFDRTQDQSIENQVRDTVEKQRDDELNSYGPDGLGRLADAQAAHSVGVGGEAARDLGVSSEDDTLPPDAEAGINRLGDLKAAASVKPALLASYHTELYSTAKRFKNMYPGKRDVVDRAISKVTGIDPANALLRDRQAMAAAAANAGDKEKQRLWSDFKGVDGAYIQAANPKADGTPVSFDEYSKNPKEFMQKAMALKGVNLQAEAKAHALELGDKNDSRSALDALRSRIAVDSDIFTNGALAKLNEERLQLQAKGKNLDPEEFAAFQARAQNTIETMRQQWQKFATASRTHKDGSMFNIQKMAGGAEPINKEIDAGLKPFTQWAELFSRKNEDGMANVAIGIQKNMKARDQLRANEMFPELRFLDAVSNADPIIKQLILQHNPAILDSLTKSVTNTAVLGIFSNSTPIDQLPSLADAAKLLPPEGKENGKANKVLINTLTGALKSGNPELAIRAAHVLYKDDKYFNELPPGQKAQAWAMLTDPSYATVLKDNPEALKLHAEWVAKVFPAVAKPEIDTLQKNVVEFDRVETQFQPDTMHFAFKLKDGTAPQAFGDSWNIGSASQDNQKNAISVEAGRAIERINTHIDRISPMLKQLYGERAPEKLIEIMKGRGLDMDAEKKGWFVEEAAKSIGGFIKEKAGEAVDKAKSVLPDFGPAPKTPEFREKRSDITGEQGSVRLLDPVADTGVKFASAESHSEAGKVMNSIAQKFVGMNERTDRATIASFIKKGMGKTVDPAKTPWCAAFLNGLIGAAGEKGTDSLAARDFLNYGKPTKTPTEGDIAVLSRGKDTSKGHVGLVQGFVNHGGEKYVRILGGNQGNRVSIMEYPVSRVLGYRKVSSTDMQKYAENEGDQPVQVADHQARTVTEIPFEKDGKGRYVVPEGYQPPDGFRGIVIHGNDPNKPRMEMQYPGPRHTPGTEGKNDDPFGTAAA